MTNTNYLLEGRIVTMTAENDVIDHGFIWVESGRIKRIFKNTTDLPPSLSQIKKITTQGTIYPGLIDLHNHYVYNILPLWVVPKKFTNRSQWPAHKDYITGISKPIREVLAKNSTTAKAIVRYVETKAIIGGSTTGQGMKTRVKGGSKLFVGAMRNVEEPLMVDLPPAGTKVPNFRPSGPDAKTQIKRFKNGITNPESRAYFYHLSEGIDKASRKHFQNLVDYDLINEKLVGIHALGLTKDDFTLLQNANAKIVWSPFSNLLLYGKTLNLHYLKKSGLLFSLGCDWSPSGSKNLLQELKVAKFENDRHGSPFSDYELCAAVTSFAAQVVGWHSSLGTLEVGKYSDLLVLKGDEKNPYGQLIEATEQDIDLLIIGGQARYGESTIMNQLYKDTSTLEEYSLKGKQMEFNLFSETSEINDLTFNEAKITLTNAMANLHKLRDQMEESAASLSTDRKEKEEDFELVLDNEYLDQEDIFQDYPLQNIPSLMADYTMVKGIELDSEFVDNEDYWGRLFEQKNVYSDLKDHMYNCYMKQ